MLAISFLYVAPTTRADKSPWALDWILSGAALLIGAYFLWQSDVIAERITLFDPLTQFDIVAGIGIIGLTIEAMRRSVGLGLTVIVLLFMAYNLFGHLIPGAFSRLQRSVPFTGCHQIYKGRVFRGTIESRGHLCIPVRPFWFGNGEVQGVGVFL